MEEKQVKRLITTIETDAETGEVIKENTYIRNKDGKREALKKWAVENKMLPPFRPNSRFTKTFHNPEIPPYNNRTYLGHFFILIRYLQPSFNTIAKLTKTEGWVELTREEIFELLGIKKSSFYLFMKESEDKNIVVKMTLKGVDRYFVNPIYAFNGNNIDYLLYYVFRQDKKLLKVLADDHNLAINAIEGDEHGLLEYFHQIGV